MKPRNSAPFFIRFNRQDKNSENKKTVLKDYATFGEIIALILKGGWRQGTKGARVQILNLSSKIALWVKGREMNISLGGFTSEKGLVLNWRCTLI